MFRILRFAYVNPFYLLLIFGYGLTRLLEWLISSKDTWDSLLAISLAFLERYKPISYIFGLPICIIILHWTIAEFFIIYDIVRRPRFIENFRFKSEPKKKFVIKEWMDIARIVATNQLIILPTSTVINYLYQKCTDDINIMNFSSVPPFTQVFYKYTLCMIIYEAVTFYFNWMSNHPLIHQDIAKRQQKSHPVECFFLSIFTITLAISISRSDPLTVAYFLTSIVIGPIFENFGFYMPLLLGPEYYENHYEYFNEYCCTSEIMDILHGTSGSYLKTQNFENHRVCLSMKPV